MQLPPLAPCCDARALSLWTGLHCRYELHLHPSQVAWSALEECARRTIEAGPGLKRSAMMSSSGLSVDDGWDKDALSDDDSGSEGEEGGGGGDAAAAAGSAPPAADVEESFKTRALRTASAYKVAPPNWTPSEAVPRCQRCDANFGIFRRKHHCRSCGRVVCSGCSQNRMALPWSGESNDVKQRVCDVCFGGS